MRRVGPEVPPTGTDGWPCLLGSIGRTARERPDGMSRGRLRVTFFFGADGVWSRLVSQGSGIHTHTQTCVCFSDGFGKVGDLLAFAGSHIYRH